MPDWNLDDLLLHREWVGRVARTLVRGDAAADDLEQEAWVRALEHPPATPLRAPRGWLRSLLRFAAIDASRAARTRRRHEEGAAARERRETEEEARKRTADEERLLALLKSRRTPFSFEGSVNLADVLSYLSAQQGLNFVADEAVGERCRALMVTLSVKDMPMNEVMDELVRLDADLQWEVRGNVVLVRGR